MPAIKPTVQLIVFDPHVRYGYVEEKAYAYRADVQRNSADWNTQNLRVLPDLGLAHLEPVYWAQPNGTGQWTLSGTITGETPGTIPWREVRPPWLGTTGIYQPRKATNVTWEAYSVSTTIDPGLWLDIWASQHYKHPGTLPPGTGTTVNDIGRMDVYYPYPTDSVDQSYRVVMGYYMSPRLDFATKTGTLWGEFKTVDMAQMSEFHTAFGRWARLMLMQAGKYFTVSLDGRTILKHYQGGWGLAGTGTPGLHTKEDWVATAGTRRGQVAIKGKAVAACFGWHPLYFRGSGSGTGTGLKRGFYNSQRPTVSAHGNRNGGTLTGTVFEQSTDGKSFSYAFGLSCATSATLGFATRTPFFSSIQMRWPAFQTAIQTAPTQELTGIYAVNDHIWFDPVTLNIYAQASCRFHNEWQDYSLTSGVRACEFWLGYVGLLNKRRMTGYAGRILAWDTSLGDKSFSMQLDDRSVTLKSPGGAMAANLPYMDGWCVYSAMRYLANYGGIPDTSLAFPLCSGDIYNPCGHYLLPWGDELHGLVHFTGGQYVWDCMQQVQQYVGYCLYFDANGYLQFYAYIPSAPGQLKKRFTLSAEVDGSGAPILNEMMGLSRIRDMGSVRNDVLVVGVDPETWQPITAHNVDRGSMDNPSYANYLGYRSPMLWANSMFCTEEYAQQAADAVFAVARLPEDRITLRGWMQPDLAPLDVIEVYDPWSAPNTRFYWVTDIVNECVLDDQPQGMLVMPTCTLTAQWLTPWG